MQYLTTEEKYLERRRADAYDIDEGKSGLGVGRQQMHHSLLPFSSVDI
jgi:hypothetical protein